jgi:uncharacterized membrane protein YciS (DUF1049 family)
MISLRPLLSKSHAYSTPKCNFRAGGPAFCLRRGRGADTPLLTYMNFKVFLRTVVVLAIVFVMLYVGMNNTHDIVFKFPVMFAKDGIKASAAFIYFAVFAVGIIAGTVIASGGASSKRGSSSK